LVEKLRIHRSIESDSFFGKSQVSIWVTLGLIIIMGLGIRLYDLTDPPLDFHSTRQLWSAIIARGMYYQGLDDVPAWQRDLAVETWKSKPAIEPTIFESIVAFTYRVVGQEIIWIPRIYSSLFWMIGGLGLYLLARDMTSIDGGVIALAFYIFVPFGAIASRSFQPDPLMVMWIILTWWGFSRWVQSPSWKTAIIAGLFAGIAMIIKSVAIFMLFGGMIALVWSGYGIKKGLKDLQVWVIAILSALPLAAYTIYGLLALGMESQFQGRFFPELLKDPTHYVRWLGEMKSIVGFSGLVLGLLGIFLFRKVTQRAFVIGLWAGYFLYGLLFPYHFVTHNYYHLPLIPLVALSLAPVADSIFERLVSLNLGWILKSGLIGVIIFATGYQMWDIRVELAQADYRHEPAYWSMLADRVGRSNQIVALTQDYGYRLEYYGWLEVRNWPETGQLAYRDLRGGKPFEFEQWFDEETLDMDYFLVTRIKELDRQPELRDMLYTHYTISDQGEGFVLFDLNQPLPQEQS
jgi:4-amino-4-deoxy-L-arabinose transferase-like glycosyltransferase